MRLQDLNKNGRRTDDIDLAKAFNIKFPETELDTFSDMEVIYNASLLKMKMHEKDITPLMDLKMIFNKAMRTLKAKMNELLLHKAFKGIS